MSFHEKSIGSIGAKILIHIPMNRQWRPYDDQDASKWRSPLSWLRWLMVDRHEPRSDSMHRPPCRFDPQYPNSEETVRFGPICRRSRSALSRNSRS